MKFTTTTSALLLAAGVSASPIAKLAARSDVTCENNASNGTIYQSTTGKYQILCGVDYAGGDMGSTSTTSFAACIDACDATVGCVDVSYVNGACYMKNTLGSPSDVSVVWTAKSTTASVSGTVTDTTAPATSPVSSTTSGLTCENNASDGTVYKTANGKDFEVFCGTDFYGGDLLNQNTDSFSACVDLCSQTDTCVDVSYVSPVCYLKNELTSAVARTWVWSAKLSTYAYPGGDSSSSSSSSVAPSSSSVAASSSTTTVVSTTSPAAQTTTVVQTTPAASSSTTTSKATTTSAAPTTTTTTSVVVSSSTTKVTTTVAPTTTKATTTSAASTTSKAVTTSVVASSTLKTSTTSSKTTAAPTSIFTILSAFYGDKDVTAAVVKNWVSANALTVDTITPALTLGVSDPWVGVVNSIVILYSVNGKQQVFSANQYTGVYILTAFYQPSSSAVSTISAPSGSAIKIVAATWGSHAVTSSTVFSKLYSSYAANSAVSFSDATFGGSLLSFLHQYTGVVYYTKNGVLNALVGREGASKRWY